MGKATLQGNAKAGHKLHLPEAVFKRLQLEAITRGVRLSTVAAEILDRHLPKLEIRMELDSAVASGSEQYLSDDQLQRPAGNLAHKELVLVLKDEWERATAAK